MRRPAAPSPGAGRMIRLIGIDARERESPFCEQARIALGELVGGATVRLVYEEEIEDRYGRTLAHLVAPGEGGGRHAGEELLRRGLASIYLIPPNLGLADRLIAAQRDAVAASRGIWSVPVTPEPFYVVGAYRFHRPSCPHAQSVPRPRRASDRRALLMEGKGPCRACRP